MSWGSFELVDDGSGFMARHPLQWFTRVTEVEGQDIVDTGLSWMVLSQLLLTLEKT